MTLRQRFAIELELRAAAMEARIRVETQQFELRADPRIFAALPATLFLGAWR